MVTSGGQAPGRVLSGFAQIGAYWASALRGAVCGAHGRLREQKQTQTSLSWSLCSRGKRGTKQNSLE